MKKITLKMFILFSAIIITSTKLSAYMIDHGELYEDNGKDIKVYYEKISGKPANGYFIIEYNRGIETLNLKNGLKNGTCTFALHSGELEHKSSYKNGKLDGYSYRYYSNGDIITKNFYINGLNEGKSYSYYENGNLEGVVQYSNGERLLREDYYKSGKLKLRKDDKKNQYTTYYATGQKSGEGYLKDNLEHRKVYYKNGNTKALVLSDKTGKGELSTFAKNGDIEYNIFLHNHQEIDVGFKYVNKEKIEMNIAETMNYLKTKEWQKNEDE